MALGWSDLTAEGKAYFQKLEELANMEVKVGFQEGSPLHVNERAGETSDQTVTQIAAYNEYGTSTIPARPFMKQSFENHKDGLQQACDQVNAKITSGGSVQAALEPLGVYTKGLVQQEITDGNFEPNAASTVKKKGSATPLIDGGMMRQSVNYIITRRSGT